MPIDIQLETSAFHLQIEGRWIKGATLEKVVDTMTHATARLEQTHSGFLNSWLATWFARRGRRQARLDVRDLSDHLKRDMGFLDGNPVGRRK
ncbi:hypothetical protein [Mesorhizobium sp. WSM2239]|uniref:Uncharacterized protein n=2 Tax=unclassified Mesorhizobium TaxID=325217 RepID=A0AAU8D8W2_9HYPH